MHIVTLSFDDGFYRSNIRIAQLYEQRGLAACFNVLATGHESTFVWPDTGQAAVHKGDFGLWNELAARGHEVMPHGYTHANHAHLSFDQARRAVEQCLDVFDEKLDGFNRRAAVFNFPYNRTTPAIEAWLPTVVRAFRGGGIEQGINPLPDAAMTAIRTTGWGPGNCEHHLDCCIAALLAQPTGWLVYNTHGLDAEGWGPIGSDYLARLLDRLLAIESVRIMPTAWVLAGG